VEKNFKYLKIFIYFFSILYFIFYFFSNPEILYQLKNLEFSELLSLFFIRIFIFTLAALYLKELISGFKIKISFLESFKVSNNSNLLNYFTPFRGGAGYRALYFKNMYNLNFKNFSKTLIIYYIFTFVQCTGVLLICLMNPQKFNYFFVFSIIFFSITAFLFFNKKYSFTNEIRNILNINVVLLRVFFIQLALLASFALNNYFIFKFLNINLNYNSVLILTCIGVLSTLLSLTPGSIGVREAFFIYFNDLINLTTFEIMQHSLLDRSINIVLLVSFFIISQVLISKNA